MLTLSHQSTRLSVHYSR